MEEPEALALLSKKRGREGSIESQQKFDFFCYDIMPKGGGVPKKVRKFSLFNFDGTPYE